METGTRTAQSIEGLHNDKGMASQRPKFWASNEANFLFSIRLKVSITNISSHELEIIEL